MPTAPKEFLDRVKKCEAKVDALHATIEERQETAGLHLVVGF
jgi:hypothetical protein